MLQTLPPTLLARLCLTPILHPTPTPLPVCPTADIAANAADEAVFAAYAAEEQQQQQQDAQLAPSLAKTSISSSISQMGLLGGQQTEWGELVHTYVAPPVVGNVYPSFGELALLYGECEGREAPQGGRQL